MASKQKIEYVFGELISRDNPKKKYTPKLKLTLVEMFVDEKTVPVSRAVSHIELTPMSGIVIEDGNYTLRFTFDGEQQEQAVKVESGTMLAA